MKMIDQQRFFGFFFFMDTRAAFAQEVVSG
jgi:hypothetical protein